MQNTVCDVCRKKVDSPVTGSTFFYYGRHGICEVCRDNLESQVKPTIRNKDPYVIEWYDKYIDDSIEKAIHKGKN